MHKQTLNSSRTPHAWILSNSVSDHELSTKSNLFTLSVKPRCLKEKNSTHCHKGSRIYSVPAVLDPPVGGIVSLFCRGGGVTRWASGMSLCSQRLCVAEWGVNSGLSTTTGPGSPPACGTVCFIGRSEAEYVGNCPSRKDILTTSPSRHSWRPGPRKSCVDSQVQCPGRYTDSIRFSRGPVMPQMLGTWPNLGFKMDVLTLVVRSLVKYHAVLTSVCAQMLKHCALCMKENTGNNPKTLQ